MTWRIGTFGISATWQQWGGGDGFPDVHRWTQNSTPVRQADYHGLSGEGRWILRSKKTQQSSSNNPPPQWILVKRGGL